VSDLDVEIDIHVQEQSSPSQTSTSKEVQLKLLIDANKKKWHLFPFQKSCIIPFPLASSLFVHHIHHLTTEYTASQHDQSWSVAQYQCWAGI
jgi:hypothetical protein